MEEISKIYTLNPPGFMREQMPQGENDIENMPIGMAYVPWQNWQDIYAKDKGIMRGTIFAQLDKPFTKGANR